MSEPILSRSTIADIDNRVLRILRDLGNPDPPVSHDMIRELVKLDKAYFQKDDPGVLSDLWSRLKRGTKQIIQRPGLLADMLTNMSLRAAYVPDAKRIYIDNTLHPMKKRWGETHECVHGILPWHKDYMLGDDKHTLTQSCREKLEAEANYGTGRLLFAGNRFNEQIADLPRSLSTVSTLSKEYKNSLTATLWRLVESTEDIPICAYICPTHSPDGKYVTGNGDSDIHFVRSPMFIEKFSNIKCESVGNVVKSYVKKHTRYLAGDAAEALYDSNGDVHTFLFETINNRYCYLTLCTWVPF